MEGQSPLYSITEEQGHAIADVASGDALRTLAKRAEYRFMFLAIAQVLILFLMSVAGVEAIKIVLAMLASTACWYLESMWWAFLLNRGYIAMWMARKEELNAFLIKFFELDKRVRELSDDD